MLIVKEELAELIKNYGIKMVWFDGCWEKPYSRENSIDLNQYLRNQSPNLIINNRIESPQLLSGDPKGDYATPEQQIGSYDTVHPWETCMTLGNQWAYRPNEKYKSFPEVLNILIETVTGDGNLLLNVGPDDTGRIPDGQQKLLRSLGDWLAKYGQSVYGTRGGPFRNGKWGGSTRKDNAIYVNVIDWGTGEIRLPSLPAKVLRTRVLQKGPKVVCTSNSEGLTLKLTGAKPAEPTTIRIDIDKNAWSLGTLN